jgi:hypothetical protein
MQVYAGRSALAPTATVRSQKFRSNLSVNASSPMRTGRLWRWQARVSIGAAEHTAGVATHDRGLGIADVQRLLEDDCRDMAQPVELLLLLLPPDRNGMA